MNDDLFADVLPAALESAPDADSTFHIGIWGTSRAGKTTYLVMLYQEFLALHETWEIFADAESEKFIRRAREEINEQHVFPEKTNEGKRYRYEVRHKPTNRAFVLEFLDAPGELYEAYYDESKRDQKSFIQQRNVQPVETNITPQQLFEYLRECDGILAFIDPGRSDEAHRPLTYTQLLYNLLQDLRVYRRASGRSAAPRLALCLTKADGKDDTWNPEVRNLDATACGLHKNLMDCPNCHLFKRLGSDFMTRTLPGLLPHRQRACFIVSSLGRGDDRSPNVSDGQAWQRPGTVELPPSALPGASTSGNRSAQPYAVQPFAYTLQLPSDETYSPKSIIDKDAFKPHNVLKPILWMLQL